MRMIDVGRAVDAPAEAVWEALVGVPATGHRVEPLGPARCRAVIEVPAWAPAYAPLCRVAVGRLGAVARDLAGATG